MKYDRSKTEMGDISTTKGLEKSEGVGLLNYIQSCSQLFAISAKSDNSAVKYVYQRKRMLEKENPNPVLPAPSPETINFVYERRKHRKIAASDKTAMVSVNSLDNGAFTDAIKSDNVLLPSHLETRGLCERDCTRVSSIEQPLTTSEAIDGYVSEDRGFEVNRLNKTIEVYSVDDSCSSSMMLDVDMGSSPLKSKVDDIDECSSSDTMVVDVMGNDQSLLVKGLCVSILRRHGLLSDFGVDRSDNYEEDGPSCSGSSSRSCNVCGVVGMASEMLICDECEEAFHASCFNPVIKNPPIDEWYCQPCSRKKHNFLRERTVRRSSIITTEKGCVTSEGDCSPISLMLQDSEPYKTGVRVGKGFQAIVPEWCGPVTRGLSTYPEPMELDPLDLVKFAEPNIVRPHKAYIGNWLQCRDIIVGVAGNIDGTICGKWRRAPLFEVQTENWDCFSSVFWDPTHADCAAPQELETEEVLRQLKYIEMLRPRLAAKRYKLEASKANGSEDGSKCTGSMDFVRNS